MLSAHDTHRETTYVAILIVPFTSHRTCNVQQVPSVRSFLTHIGASVSLAGLLIGCCDLTSMPSTVGAQPPCLRPHDNNYFQIRSPRGSLA